MGWLVTLGILVLLGLIPLGVSVIYDEDGVLARIIAGPLKIKVYPLPHKEKKPEKEKPKKEKKPEKNNTSKSTPAKAQKNAGGETTEKKSGGPITDFLALVRVVLKFLD